MARKNDQTLEEARSKVGGLTVCPRCGGIGWEYTRDVKGRVYVYVLHKVKVGRKTVTRHCYLGPLDSYVHTYVTNQITLRGLIDPHRYLKYLDAIFDKLAELASKDPDSRREILEKLEELEERIRELREHLEAG